MLIEYFLLGGASAVGMATLLLGGVSIVGGAMLLTPVVGGATLLTECFLLGGTSDIGGATFLLGGTSAVGGATFLASEVGGAILLGVTVGEEGGLILLAARGVRATTVGGTPLAAAEGFFVSDTSSWGTSLYLDTMLGGACLEAQALLVLLVGVSPWGEGAAPRGSTSFRTLGVVVWGGAFLVGGVDAAMEVGGWLGSDV